LDNRDRLQVIVFSTGVNDLSPLSPLANKREEVTRRVSGLIENGDTALYDATLQAINGLKAQRDPDHIRGVVVLSDGQDTASRTTLEQLMAQIGVPGEEGGNAIKLFTIAFGSDADTEVLRQMAESTGGKQYSSDPATISQVYAEIALFF
jgi:Ca-activated chloride channel family protein